MMLRVRSARGRALAAFIVLLPLLVAVVLLATWRAQQEHSDRAELEQRAAVVASLENAQARFFRGTVLITAAVFMQDPVPLIASYHQVQVQGDESLKQARSGLIALDESGEISVLDSFAEQMGQLRQEVDTVLTVGVVAERSTRVELGLQYYPQMWPRIEAMMATLEQLSGAQQAELVTGRAAADQASDANLALLIGFSTFAFLGGAALLAALIISIVRPLSALRESARAVASGNMEARAKVAGPEEVASLARDFNEMVDQRKQAEEALQERTHDLSERAKELKCLYEISNLVQKPDISPEDLLQGAVDLIPSSWQYPEVTCARITLDGREFRTENFRETAWRQTSDIIVNGEQAGAVEVCYLEEEPGADEGPFLNEERDLVNAIAERLGRITERERAEQALRESEAKYRRVFESIQDILYRTDAQGIIVEISPSVQRFGYSREQMIGTQVMDVYENPEQRSALVKAVIEHGDVADHEIRLRRGDGRVIDISVSAHVLRDEDGTFIGTEGTLRDISDRKAVEEALREQARRDPLTGVLNHGAIVDEMRRLISVGEQAAPWAVAMIDVNRLKATNDTYGHQVGDAVLSAVAAGLSMNGAVLGRYGGDEFVAILPGADRQAAERYCGEAMDALARATVSDPQTGERVPVEASIGLAIFPEDARTLAGLINASDSAMYATKRQRPARRAA
jgi:diguanylate cyclase (GGDEF)-like protein/PAS domain S-box-containing protein